MVLQGVGEKASAGTVHFDNVAASLYGGFVLLLMDTKLVGVETYHPGEEMLGKYVPLHGHFHLKILDFVVAVPKIKSTKTKNKGITRLAIPKNVKFSDA